MADLIASFIKNQSEEVRVALSSFHGRELLDLRVWADFRDAGPERKPTKSGFSIRVDLIPELRRAIDAAEAQARSRGLLSQRYAEPPETGEFESAAAEGDAL